MVSPAPARNATLELLGTAVARRLPAVCTGSG